MGQKDLVLRTYLSDEKRFADLFNTYLGEREIFPEFLRELESVRIRKDEETQKVKRVEHDVWHTNWRNMKGKFENCKKNIR